MGIVVAEKMIEAPQTAAHPTLLLLMLIEEKARITAE